MILFGLMVPKTVILRRQSRKDDLANWGNRVLYGDMLRWIREEWQRARIGMRIVFILIVMLLLAGLAGVTYLTGNWYTDPIKIEQPEESKVVKESRDTTDQWQFLSHREAREQDILREYFKVMGGVDKLASMKSIRATGEATFPDGRIMRVVVVKKEGGLIRFILGIPPRQIVIGVNPEDAWQSSWDHKKQVVEDLDPEDLVNMRRSGYPVSKLFMAMYNEWSIAYLGEKAFNYKMAYVFEVKIGEHESARFFIDPETFKETGFEEWVIDEEGVTITRHIQSDHFEADGLLFPGKVETYINGELSHTFTVQKVEVNPGILNSSFYRPVLEP